MWRETERGFVALGTPIGHLRFVAAHTDVRLHEEGRLLHELPMLLDLQCAWLLLVMCLASRRPCTCCAPSGPTSLPAMRVGTTTPSGDVCSRCWAKRTTRVSGGEGIVLAERIQRGGQSIPLFAAFALTDGAALACRVRTTYADAQRG